MHCKVLNKDILEWLQVLKAKGLPIRQVWSWPLLAEEAGLGSPSEVCLKHVLQCCSNSTDFYILSSNFKVIFERKWHHGHVSWRMAHWYVGKLENSLPNLSSSLNWNTNRSVPTKHYVSWFRWALHPSTTSTINRVRQKLKVVLIFLPDFTSHILALDGPFSFISPLSLLL